jgi:hypothetical protein
MRWHTVRQWNKMTSDEGLMTKHDKNTWLAFADKLSPVGYKLFDHVNKVPITENGAADVRILAIALLARTISNLKATLLLIRADSIVEARTISRCCFENLFMIAALATQSDEFVKEYVRDDIATRKLRGEHILRQTSKSREPKGWKMPLCASLKEWKNFPASKTLTPKSIAAKGPVEGAYIFHSQLSADAAHPTTDALSRYLSRFEENGIEVRGIDINPVPDEQELADTLYLVCNAVIGVYIGVNQILDGTEATADIIALSDEYLSLSKDA